MGEGGDADGGSDIRAARSAQQYRGGADRVADRGDRFGIDVVTGLSSAWGTDSVNIGIGGSIPFIADLTEVFPQAQILVTGVEDPDSRAHSPNESVDLAMLQKAMVAEALLLLHGNSISQP